MIRETKVPAIPDIRDDNLPEVLRAIKSTIDVREGSIGDPLDQAVTLRDLADLNLVVTGGSTTRQAGGSLPVTTNLPPVVDGYNPATDATVPPAPTGLRAKGGFTNVYLDWDGAPYRNHGYTEIWRSETDSLASALLVGTTAASVYADPAAPDTTYFYWIRFVSAAAITGPYNQTSGTSATTALDIGRAIDALSSDLQRSQLFVDLGRRVQLIEADAYFQNLTSGLYQSQIERLSATLDSTTSQITSLRAVNGNNATLITQLRSSNAATDARVTSVEQTKIGYATLNSTGLVFDNNGAIVSKAGVDAWNAANPGNQATWHVGLPFATAVKQVSVSDGSNTLTLEQRFTAQKQINNELYGQYTVKIDNRGHVAGFGLASGSVDGTPTSAFIVRADRFGIAGVNDPSDPLGTLAPTSKPFIVTSTPTTVNGKTYPAGTWIDTAFIANATITNAQIADLTADKITAGTLSSAMGVTTGKLWGGVAVSGNKNDGTFGNLLQPFGSAAFGTGFFLGNDGGAYKFYVGSPTQNMNWNGSALTVSGTINATSGVFRNITVYDNQDRVILSSGGINPSLLGLGSLAFSNSVSTSQVSGLGSLATQNTVSTAQVTGLGALATQNTVSTGQVTGLGALATQSSVFVGSTVKFPDGSTLNTIDFVNRLTKVSTGNISNFFNTAAIGDAYIGNLNAAKITAGFLSADRIASGSLDAKIANIDAAVIKSGTIDNARIGDLSAKRIYTGNSTAAVDFVDPSYVNVPMRSYAAGFLAYTGNTALSVYVPATCYDYNGNPYNCSYWTVAGASIITGELVKFKCVDASWPLERRLRTGAVQFFIMATATVDHYFSIWYRKNGGAWIHLGEAIEQAGSYGTVGLQYSGVLVLAAGDVVEVGMSATNSALTYWNTNATEIRYGALTAWAINF